MVSRTDMMEIWSCFLPRVEKMKLLLYLTLKFPWCPEPHFQKCPEIPPVRRPTQFSSTSWGSSVRTKKIQVCFMRGYLLDRDQYPQAMWAPCCLPGLPASTAATGLSISSGQELPAEPPSPFQPTQRGFSAQISSKNRVILKDVH